MCDDNRHQPDILFVGGNCSQFLAQYVSQENARLYANEHPLAAVTILNSTYMDDSVDSVKNNEQAIEFHSHKYPDGSP